MVQDSAALEPAKQSDSLPRRKIQGVLNIAAGKARMLLEHPNDIDHIERLLLFPLTSFSGRENKVKNLHWLHSSFKYLHVKGESLFFWGQASGDRRRDRRHNVNNPTIKRLSVQKVLDSVPAIVAYPQSEDRIPISVYADVAALRIELKGALVFHSQFT